jgi:hypothetical protein
MLSNAFVTAFNERSTRLLSLGNADASPIVGEVFLRSQLYESKRADSPKAVMNRFFREVMRGY